MRSSGTTNEINDKIFNALAKLNVEKKDEEYIIEIMYMLKERKMSEEDVIKFIETQRKPSNLIWNQEFKYIYESMIDKDIEISHFTPKNEKSEQQCKNCKKKGFVTFTFKQTRSSDEPLTTIYNCGNCKQTWRS